MNTKLLDHTGTPVENLPPAPRRAVAVAPVTAAAGSLTPMELLQRAVEGKADLATIEKLMDLQERWEKSEARKAFVAALAAFKAEPLRIIKDRHVNYTPKNGGQDVDYHHASLAQICDVAGQALGKHGLSFRWRTDQVDNGQIVVACILTHERGHSEEVVLKSSRDNSGGKNDIQAIGSAITYLQRYTLMAITGLAAADQDDDGAGSEGKEETISEAQYTQIADLIQDTKADLGRFLAYFKIEAIGDLPAWRFDDAIAMLEQKRTRGTGPVAR